MKLSNWRIFIQGRNKWEMIVEKANTFSIWSCNAWWRSIFLYMMWNKNLLVTVQINQKCNSQRRLGWHNF
jgi:hypothetical protein